MYQLTSVFNRSALADVLQGLYDEQIEGITVTDVLGKGSFGIIESDLDEKVMVTIIVSSDHFKEKAMEAIRSNTQDTGHGSGTRFGQDVGDAGTRSRAYPYRREGRSRPYEIGQQHDTAH